MGPPKPQVECRTTRRGRHWPGEWKKARREHARGRREQGKAGLAATTVTSSPLKKNGGQPWQQRAGRTGARRLTRRLREGAGGRRTGRGRARYLLNLTRPINPGPRGPAPSPLVLILSHVPPSLWASLRSEQLLPRLSFTRNTAAVPRTISSPCQLPTPDCRDCSLLPSYAHTHTCTAK